MNKNDQDDLIKDIDQLSEEFNDLDGRIEEFNKEVVASEENVQEEEEPTEFSQYIKEREAYKDHRVGSDDHEVDEAAYGRNDLRESNTLKLESIVESCAEDKITLETALEQLPPSDPLYDQALGLLKEVEKLSDKSNSVSDEWHKNDLPPLNPENCENSHKPQDSSDVHQTDFNSFEPFDD